MLSRSPRLFPRFVGELPNWEGDRASGVRVPWSTVASSDGGGDPSIPSSCSAGNPVVDHMATGQRTRLKVPVRLGAHNRPLVLQYQGRGGAVGLQTSGRVYEGLDGVPPCVFKSLRCSPRSTSLSKGSALP